MLRKLSANIIKKIKKDYKKSSSKISKSFQRRKRKQNQQYGQERYKNLLEGEKQKFVE